MRSLSRLVGVLMAVGGLGAVVYGIIAIGRFVGDLTSTGSFGCETALCDPIGDAPGLIGGGITLILVGTLIATLGSAFFSPRSGGPTPNTLSSGHRAHLTGWDQSTLGGMAIATELGPMLRQMVESLEASGLLAGTVAAGRMLDSATGQPAMFGTPQDMSADGERDRRLRATGTLARAVVDSFRELPMSTPEGALHEFQLEVRPEDRPSYKVRHYALVPSRWSYRVTLGASFPAWVDPADPSRLLIEWERS